MCIALFSSFSSSAQNFTKRYEQTGGYVFNYNDAVVMEKFRPTAVYPFNGTVVFQPIDNAGITDLQVNIMDDNGSLQSSRIYQIDNSNSFLSQDFIPVAAAYNELTEEYCIAGVVQTGSLCDYSTWVGVFDENLSLIDFRLMDVQTSTFASANLNSCFVTDICPVYTHPNGVDFALTGVLIDGGDNPAPAKSLFGSPTIIDKRLFLVEFETNSLLFQTATELELIDQSQAIADKASFPSRIIEIPDINNTGGYLIAGSTSYQLPNTPYDLSLFYLRVNFNGTIDDIQQRQQNILTSSHLLNFFIGDLKYDFSTDEVRVAGSIRDLEGTENGFFADKLTGVTANTIIVLYSDTWNGTPQLGIFEIPASPLLGWVKVGRMSNQIDERNVITATLLENGSSATNQTMKLPMMFSILYDDFNLNNWLTAQIPNIYWYKRWATSSGPVQYYTGLDYTSQWYPNHYSFPLDESNAVQSFVHGTYCSNTGGDHLVITQTDNYNQNSCSFNGVEGEFDFVDLLAYSYSAVTNPVSITQSQVLVIDFGSNQIDEYSCNPSDLFKPSTNNLVVQQSGEQLLVKGLEEEAHFILYSLSGAKLKEGKVLPFGNINIDNLCRGMYILHINDQVIKISK